MLRGRVDLEPTRGGEADRRRPAVLVSNDRANAAAAQLGRGVVTVVPVTGNTNSVFSISGAAASGGDGLGGRLESPGRAGARRRGRTCRPATRAGAGHADVQDRRRIATAPAAVAGGGRFTASAGSGRGSSRRAG
ncbi:hypothetical protein D1871_17470 [Nakamurella silvestris]|nr:hypothetical protein D1871_17470 [Nakamurella silvestris]